jgi:hypothetical protein
MHVLRHKNIPSRHEAIPYTHGLTLEDAIGSLPRQQRLPAITTEGQKVKTAAPLITNNVLCRDEKIVLPMR